MVFQLAVYGELTEADVAIVVQVVPSGERWNTTVETPVPVSAAVADSTFVAPCRSADPGGVSSVAVGVELSTVTVTGVVPSV
jgi:hypothetical protein